MGLSFFFYILSWIFITLMLTAALIPFKVMKEKSSVGSSPATNNGTPAKRGDDEEEEEEDIPVFPSPAVDSHQGPEISQVSHASRGSRASQGSSLSEEPGRHDDRTLGENNPSFSQTASDDDSKCRGCYTVAVPITFIEHNEFCLMCD